MELKRAKRKKHSEPQYVQTLERNSKCIALFEKICCSVANFEDIFYLQNLGCYGKGSLSKSEPCFNGNTYGLPDALLEQQYNNRCRYSASEKVEPYISFLPAKELKTMTISASSLNLFFKRLNSNANLDSAKKWKKFKKSERLVCDDKSQDESNSFLNFIDTNEERVDHRLTDRVQKIIMSRNPSFSPRIHDHSVIVLGSDGPRMEVAPPNPKEKLVLDLQEAFFLASLDVLTIVECPGNELSLSNAWKMFRLTDPRFLERYVAYHWYRSKGWIVQCGIKYGGDYVLYERAPSFCHSSYVVRICDPKTSHSWEDLGRLQRLVETIKKDILLCVVVPPSSEWIEPDDASPFDIISKYQVAEIMWRRWIPSQQRKAK